MAQRQAAAGGEALGDSSQARQHVKVLVGGEVISVLPQMQAVLLVAGIGNTSVSDIKECHKHLKTMPVVRVVVNRVTEATDAYYGYY